MGIPIVTNCAILLADLLLFRMKQYSCRDSGKITKRDWSDRLILLFAISMMLCHGIFISDYVYQIYHSELEIKETTDSKISASYLDLFLKIDQEQNEV